MAVNISPEACAQARVSVLVAQIQAAGAKEAAQATRLTGVLTVVGGFGAIVATYINIRRQARLTEQQDRFKTRAFYRYVRTRAVAMEQELDFYKTDLNLERSPRVSDDMKKSIARSLPSKSFPAKDNFQEEFDAQSWEKLANARGALSRIDLVSAKLIEFDQCRYIFNNAIGRDPENAIAEIYRGRVLDSLEAVIISLRSLNQWLLNNTLPNPNPVINRLKSLFRVNSV